MTVVVGVVEGDYVVLAADTQGSTPYVKVDLEESKLFNIGKLCFGYCGSIRVAQLIKYHISEEDIDNNLISEDAFAYVVTVLVPKIREVLTDNRQMLVSEESESMINDLIVAFDGNLFTIEPNFGVFKHEKFAAIGAGEEIALGCLETTRQLAQDELLLYMEPEQVAILAVDVTKEFSLTCGKGTEIMTTKGCG